MTMQNVAPEPTETLQMNSSTILYINSIGAIIDDCLLLHSPNRWVIEIESIRRAEIHKSRNFIYNLFFFFCTFPLVYVLFSYHFTYLEKILMGAMIALLLVYAFTIKKLKYILFIKKFDQNFIEIEVNEYCKEDAKQMVRFVNKKIKLSRRK